MKAAQFSRFGGPEVLEIVELPDPHTGPGQVRIVVRAAALSATAGKARSGELGGELPQTTGRSIAGIVDEVGDGVGGVAVGDHVFGVSDDNAGAAELAVATYFAPVPTLLGFVDAAALPNLETAARGLDALPVAAGDTVLVSGASGGIGSVVVQLALARGMRVIGTAGAANVGFVRSLGAQAVSYGEGLAGRVRELAPGGVDAALDVAGHGVLPVLIELAGGADRVVTLADVAGAAEHGVHFSRGEDGRAFYAFTEVAQLIAAGRFWLPVERTFPLAEIAEATRLSEAGGARGRLVLIVGGPD